MSNPPEHLSRRTLLPGALLAMLVTAAAVFALAVVVAVGPDGPARLWLDGGGSTTNLQARADAERSGAAAGAVAFQAAPVGRLTDAPTAGPKGSVTLAAAPRAAVRLRGGTRVQRRAARLPSASRPSQPAPSASAPASRVSSPSSRTPRPVASPAPGSTVVKNRGHGKADGNTDSDAVPKQRVRSSNPDPRVASAPAQPAPAGTPAPTVATRVNQPSSQQDASVGAEDGVLTRVQPAPTGSGG